MGKKINYDLGENIHDTVTRNHITWFPGHMNKAIKQIKEKLRQVDVVLELRDARTPLATANHMAIAAIGEKCRLIVINKANLADPEMIKQWETWFREQGVPFLFTNCFDKVSRNKIVRLAKKIVHEKKMQSNPGGYSRKKFRMMIIGVPNTGKSTIINQLAQRNASKAADKPGQTQCQLWVKVDDELEILDTPGVMPPKVATYEQGLWLAAIHAIPEKIVDAQRTAIFIIEHFLKLKANVFQERYKLENLDMSFIEVLDQVGRLRGCILKKGLFDYDRIYKIIIIDFRTGELGPISLGIPPLKKIKKDKNESNH